MRGAVDFPRRRVPLDRARPAGLQPITPGFVDMAVAGRDEDVEQAITPCRSQS